MNKFKIQCINLILDKVINETLDYTPAEQAIAYLMVYNEPLVNKTDEHLMDMVWDEYADEINDLDEFSSVPDRTIVENWIMKQEPTQWFSMID